MTQKTFVLGLGAPKSGTTWLHRYISEASVSNMGCRKEYRVLPGLFSDAPLRSRFNFYRLFDRKFGVLPIPNIGQVERLKMISRKGYYERYFAGLVNDDVWLTGDISPSYMTMTADQLSSVAQQLRAVGFQVKVIFLMRDPVKRCWSGARMRIRNRDQGFENLSEEEVVRQIYSSKGVDARTRYDHTMATIDEVFAPEDVFFGLFEELFTEAQVDRLSEFLGVPKRYDMIGRVFNKTQSDGDLPDALVADIKAHFEPVYQACHARFPQTKDLWT